MSDRIGRKMDRLEAVRLARKAGLPAEVAERIADVVGGAGLGDDRREEVFRELVSHFEDGLAAGKTAAELLRSFGDGTRTAALIGASKRVVTPEAAGGTGGDGWLRRIARDARYATRRLMARPAFTATAILSLALGIGANSAMFTLVNDVILRRPPLTSPETLVDVYQATRGSAFNLLSEPDIADLRRETSVFAGLASTKFSLVPYQVGDRLDRLTVELISADYFETLGIGLQLGRPILPADAPAPGQGAVVVISDRLWRRGFGADRSVVGRTIKLNGSSFEIVGVAPPDYPGRLRGVATDLFAPVMMADQFEPGTNMLQARTNTSSFLTARLARGATIERARVELARLADELKARRTPHWEDESSVTVLPKVDVIIHPPIDRFLVPIAGMLMLVVGLVLVIACANLAGFLLARAVDRRKELAVRLALGATRGRLVSQLLVETVLLALTGGLVGVLLGRAALRLVLASDIPLPITVDLALTLDGRVVGFSILVSILAGIFFGLLPALRATRLEIASVIRDEATGGGRRKWALRHVLVGSQVAVSMVLLVIAGLFVRSLDAARRIDPGFGGRPTAAIWLGFSGAPRSEQSARSIDRLVREVAALPGVEAVGRTINLHLNALSNSTDEITVDGIEPPPGRATHQVDVSPVDTGFISAAGIRLIRGRNLTQVDVDSSRAVALVNEAFAARFFPGRDAVGQRYRNGSREYQVVGVVSTAKIRSLGEPPRPFIYAPIAPRDDYMWLLARTSGDAEALGRRIQTLAAGLDPDLFPIQATTLGRHVSGMSYPLKLGATALTAFAALALLLACIGLYGAVSYAVAQRSREVGIRLSLGAGQGSVVRLLLSGGLRMVAGGAVVGFVLALVLGRLLQGLLFGIDAFDPLTLVIVPVALLGAALLAAWIPARRAGRIDPLIAIKAE